MDNEERGTLNIGEPHPSSHDAMDYLREKILVDFQQLAMLQEAFASCAIEGNRLAEICGGTLDRLCTGKPVSDRYLLGLAWYIKTYMEKNELTDHTTTTQ